MEATMPSKHRTCRPPKGMTYLTIGQDYMSIYNFILAQYNTSLHADPPPTSAAGVLADFFPAAVMVYTDLESLLGLDQPIDYGSGIQYADGILQSLISPHPQDQDQSSSIGLQIGLWLNGTYGCEQIIHGDMDSHIQKLAHYITTSRASKVFLRIGYEFDNPYFGYSQHPKTFVLAYQHVVTQILSYFAEMNQTHHHHNKLQQHGMMNKVQFVWHSWGAPTWINSNDNNNDWIMDTPMDQTFQQFYPGDEYVDWVGVSIFQQVYPWLNPKNSSILVDDGEEGETKRENSIEEDTNAYSWAGSLQYVENVLDFAQLHKKPIMIAESTPFGGIHLQHNKQQPSALESNAGFTAEADDPWEPWYRPVLSLIEKYDISMWSYIDCDWDSLPMWKGVGFGDSRIASDAIVMKHWQDVMLQETSMGRQFLQGNTMDLCIHEEEDDKGGPDVEVPITIIVIPPKKKPDENKKEKNSLRPSDLKSREDSTLFMVSAVFVVVFLWFRCRGWESIREEGTEDETIPIVQHAR